MHPVLGGAITILKNISQLGVGMIIPYIVEKKMFQTTNQIKIIPIDIIPLYKQYETQTTNQNLLQALFTESCQISFCAMLLNRDKSELPCQQKNIGFSWKVYFQSTW